MNLNNDSMGGEEILKEWRDIIIPICLSSRKNDEFEFHILNNSLGVVCCNRLYECNIINGKWEVCHNGHIVCRKNTGSRRNFLKVLSDIKAYNPDVEKQKVQYQKKKSYA